MRGVCKTPPCVKSKVNYINTSHHHTLRLVPDLDVVVAQC